jgi:hypothetical protein
MQRFDGQICDKKRFRKASTAASLRRVRVSGPEREDRQLIKRINRFEADQEKHGNHQIKAKMHEDFAIDGCWRRAGRASVGKSNSGAQRKTPLARQNTAGNENRKASAAAEVMRSPRTSSIRRSLVRRQPAACSRAVENP